MSYRNIPKVVMANTAVGARVVFLTDDDEWTFDLSEAELLYDEAHAQLRLLEGLNRQMSAVGVHLADVTPTMKSAGLSNVA